MGMPRMGMPRMGMEVLLVKKGGSPMWALYHKIGASTRQLSKNPFRILTVVLCGHYTICSARWRSPLWKSCLLLFSLSCKRESMLY